MLIIETIFPFIQESLSLENPFVFYKKPFEDTLKGLVQKNNTLFSQSDFLENGFIFSPFDTKQESVFFPLNQSDRFEINIKSKNNPPFLQGDVYLDDNQKDAHIKLVQKAIDFIKQGNAEKVVISRKQSIPFTENHEKMVSIFENLLHLYPEAMVYLWFHPRVGLWMGATPEQLVSLDKNSFKTMALAGTQLYQENLTWQEKEKTEQKYVTDYIENQLHSCSINLEISEPFSKKAGHLAHICTEIKGTLKPSYTIKHLIDVLHPTPAVCGTPKKIAKNFILENEGYDRKFYSGFLGEINSEAKSDLYVNLRCMEWGNNSFSIYVGGGITAESIAEKEWIETVNKAKVMGKMIV